ncbi:MAG TPA: hypothetical protein DHV89_01955, partial [Ruminococcus sp.]|nr:hypothetical protein [Ruminococcus sp.]
ACYEYVFSHVHNSSFYLYAPEKGTKKEAGTPEEITPRRPCLHYYICIIHPDEVFVNNIRHKNMKLD